MKVNLGNSELKKSYFPITLDSSTTTNFGEVLPFFCHEVVPDSHVNIDLGSAVRFAPMSFPTFGKATLRNYIKSQKLSDLYPPFNDLLAQTPYTSGTGLTYIPYRVPSIPNYYLWLIVNSFSDYNFFVGDSLNPDGSVGLSPTGSPFITTNFNLEKVSNVQIGSSVSGVNPLDSSLILYLLFSLSSDSQVNYGFDGPRGLFSYSSLFLDYITDSNRDEFVSDISHGSYSSRFDGSLDPSSCDLIIPIRYSSPDGSTDSNTPYYLLDSISYNPDTSSKEFVQDSILVHVPNTYNDSSHILFVGLRLNNTGKLLRKLFMGLGYKISPISDLKSILPLYAFFKSYFEIFAPKRFVKFEQTYFARLINVIVNNNSDVQYLVAEPGSDLCFGMSSVLDDLLSCYYVKDTDYYSAAIIGMINDYGADDISMNYIGVSAGKTTLETMTGSPGSESAPAIAFDGGPLEHSQAQQNILSRLTQFLNRRSVLGGKLAELLKSTFGISPKEVEEYNSYVGSNIVDVDFNDVFSTAETELGSLGEYAGRAVGSGRSDGFHVSLDTFAYIIGLFTIVPRTQYVDGVNPLFSHLGYTDFYNPMYDGLTLLPVAKSSLYSPQGFYPYSNVNSFGNLPLYSEYKTKSQGLLSGDLSLPSTRSTYDSFTMDEVMTPYVYNPPFDENNKTTYSIAEVNYDKLVCGTMWRYLGRWLWLGRFDRIFVNQRQSYQDFIDSINNSVFNGVPYTNTRDFSRSDDNLIVHQIVDLKINAPMLPLKDSFMTQDIGELDRNGLTSQIE